MAHERKRLLDANGVVDLNSAGVKAADQSLSGNKWLLIIENAPNVVTTFALDRTITYINRPVEGYDSSQIVGRKLSDFMDQNNLRSINYAFDKVLRTGSTVTFEVLAGFPGDHRWFSSIVGPIKSGGKIVEFLMFSTDITKEKAVQKALQKSEEKYRKLFNTVPVGLFRIRLKDSKLLECNQAFAQLAGFQSRKECLTRFACDVYRFDRGVIKTFLRRVRKSRRVDNFVFRYCQENKGPFWMSCSAKLCSRGCDIEGAISDITERELIRERLNLFMESATDAFFLYDADARLLELNNVGLNMVSPGAPKEHIIGKTFQEVIQETSPNAKESDNYQKILKAINSRKAICMDGEIPYAENRPGFRYVQIKGFQVGQGFGLIISDISDRKRAEKDLKNAYQKTQQLVKDRTADLVSANELLKKEVQEHQETELTLIRHQAKLRSLSSALVLAEESERRRIAMDLHDGIGHALANVRFRLGSMMECAPSADFAANLRWVGEIIDGSIKDMQTLIFDLSPPVLYDLNLEAALDWLAEQVRLQHQINVILDAPMEPKPLDICMRVLIFRAVKELLFNIVKHAKAKEAIVSLRYGRRNIHIAVEDNGVGFDIGVLNPSDKRSTRFGLFSLGERLRNKGGELTVSSEPGKGTRVRLTLQFPRKR